jgi:hypothetical protein
MLTRPTVLVLGAGASIPYKFPSGQELLRMARVKEVRPYVGHLSEEEQQQIPAFLEAVKGTLEKSLDAMLETRDDITAVGKGFMARALLNCERSAKLTTEEPAGAWYRELWSAISADSLEQVSRCPLTIVTYNYDRSLEYSLIRALQTKFRRPTTDCAKALDSIGPIHVHGCLGLLPELAEQGQPSVPYGGDVPNITARNCTDAGRAIRIIHEAKPQDEAFIRARDALSSAERIVFLGFGYARQNVERLQLHTCASKEATIYLCTAGFTPQQQNALVRPFFGPWIQRLQTGLEDEDIAKFLRRFPEIFL